MNEKERKRQLCRTDFLSADLEHLLSILKNCHTRNWPEMAAIKEAVKKADRENIQKDRELRWLKNVYVTPAGK
jgi:hypothetical protein